MVLVRVGQDEHVDRTSPPGHVCAELPQRPVGVRASVYQHAATGRRHNQDAVALSDVHDDQMQAPIRQCRDRRHSQRCGEDEQHAMRPPERVDKAIQPRSEGTDDGMRS